MCVCTHADMMFPTTFRPDPVKDENHRLRTELAEWKLGKKRVFWRVRSRKSGHYLNFKTRIEGRAARSADPKLLKLTRVTVKVHN